MHVFLLYFQMDQPVLDSSWNEEAPHAAPFEPVNLQRHQVVVPSPQPVVNPTPAVAHP